MNRVEVKRSFFSDLVSLNQIQANCRKHSLNTYKHEKSSKSRIRILGRSSQWNVKLRHLMGAIRVFILFGSSTNRGLNHDSWLHVLQRRGIQIRISLRTHQQHCDDRWLWRLVEECFLNTRWYRASPTWSIFGFDFSFIPHHDFWLNHGVSCKTETSA